jgi:aryl sulfotransferase
VGPRVVYKDQISDNSRWDRFVHRPGDIFVCAPPKCGTTWTQTIVVSLLFPDGDAPGSVADLTPWLDARFTPLDALLAALDAQAHRRCIKTHTPADGIPWFETGRYIAVGRDGRDQLMSLVNHLSRMKVEEFHTDTPEGNPVLPNAMKEVHAFFPMWLAGGEFFTNLRTYWDRRESANLLLVHHQDLKADLEGEMRRIADFLEIDLSASQWLAVVERCTFDAMRGRARQIGDFDRYFEGGAQGFLYKGTNGRWRDELTDDEVAAYGARVAELCPPDMAAWIERGRLGGAGVG